MNSTLLPFVVSTITYRGRICTQCRPKDLYLFFFFFEIFDNLVDIVSLPHGAIIVVKKGKKTKPRAHNVVEL